LSPPYRGTQWQHTGRPAEAHRPRHPSGAPLFISEIEIDVTGMLGDADVDGALGSIELCSRLEQVER
jgi:hypothetical protein